MQRLLVHQRLDRDVGVVNGRTKFCAREVSLSGGGRLTYCGVREVLNQATCRRRVATALSELDEYREAREDKQHINEVSGGLRL
jgi:hypothetical protein